MISCQCSPGSRIAVKLSHDFLGMFSGVLDHVLHGANIGTTFAGVLGRFWGDPVSDLDFTGRCDFSSPREKLTSVVLSAEVVVFSYMAKFTRKNTPVKVHNLTKVFAYYGHVIPFRKYLRYSEKRSETIFKNCLVHIDGATIR